MIELTEEVRAARPSIPQAVKVGTLLIIGGLVAIGAIVAYQYLDKEFHAWRSEQLDLEIAHRLEGKRFSTNSDARKDKLIGGLTTNVKDLQAALYELDRKNQELHARMVNIQDLIQEY